MAISSVGVRTANLTISQASAEIICSAAVKPRILELSIIQSTNVSQSLGLGRPAAKGITPSQISSFQPEDPNDPASSVTIALAWATSPTTPTIFERRWNSAAVIGVGVIWAFPRGLAIPVSNSIVVFNLTAAQASDVSVVLDE